MSRAVQLGTLRTRVRRRTDTENETTRFPDAELNDAINEGIAKLHSRIVRARGPNYHESTYTLTTASGTEMYALPASFLSLLKVHTVIDDVERVLTPYEFVDTDGWSDTVSWSSLSDVFYRLRGDNISFRPVPDAAYSVVLTFTPTSVILGSDSDTVDGIDGLEEFVVAWAGKRVATKQRDWQLCNLFDAEMERGFADVDAMAASRDAAMPPVMLDVRSIQTPRSRRTWRL